jgi:hypothetical protein
MFRGEFGLRKENISKLSYELERQADIYRVLGVSKDAIMKLLAPRPDRLPKFLNIPVVTLGTSVDLQKQADFAGIRTEYDLSRGHDVAGGITFTEPHLIWMQDGRRYLNRSVEWVLSYIHRNERPATQSDGLALYIVSPEFQKLIRYDDSDLITRVDHVIFGDHPLLTNPPYSVNFPGTLVGTNRMSYLEDTYRGLVISHDMVGAFHPGWGALTCGS